MGLSAAALFAVADAYSLVAVLLIGRLVAGIHCGTCPDLHPHVPEVLQHDSNNEVDYDQVWDPAWCQCI